MCGAYLDPSRHFYTVAGALNIVTMPRLSLDARRRVIILFEKGNSVRRIQQRLGDENIIVTRQTLHRLIRKFKTRDGMIADLPRRKQARKLTSEMLEIIDREL